MVVHSCQDREAARNAHEAGNSIFVSRLAHLDCVSRGRIDLPGIGHLTYVVCGGLVRRWPFANLDLDVDLDVD
jgi:hypothetical protein